MIYFKNKTAAEMTMKTQIKTIGGKNGKRNYNKKRNFVKCN